MNIIFTILSLVLCVYLLRLFIEGYFKKEIADKEFLKHFGFTREHLDNMRYEILKLPYVEAAKYADSILKMEVEKQNPIIRENILQMNEFDVEIFESMNATSVGNLCYVFINYVDTEVTEKARTILINYTEYCKQKKYI